MDLLSIIQQNTTEEITKRKLSFLFGEDVSVTKREIEKAKHGVYVDNPENRSLHRVGQEYGSKSKQDQPTQEVSLDEEESNKREVNPQVEQVLRKYAKETPTEQLQKFIKTTKDEVAKKYAEEEIRSRKSGLESRR